MGFSLVCGYYKGLCLLYQREKQREIWELHYSLWDSMFHYLCSSVQPSAVVMRSSAYSLVKKASHYNKRMFLLWQDTVVYLFILCCSSIVCFFTFKALFIHWNGVYIVIKQMLEPVHGLNEIKCLSDFHLYVRKQCHQSHKLR